MTRHVLIIDDEPNMRWILGKALEQAGYTVSLAGSGDEGLAALARNPIELVLLDVKLKGQDGIAVLQRLRERRPDIVVLMITAYGTVPNAVTAMQLGAADFLRKPFDVEEIVFKVARALERRTLQHQVVRLMAAQHAQDTFSSLVGSDPVWQRLIAQATHIAGQDLHTLLLGEAGTGRGSIARAIHMASMRRASPLVETDLTIYAPASDALFGIGRDDGLWGSAGNGTIIIRGLFAHPETLHAIAKRLDESVAAPRLIVLATPDEATATATSHILTTSVQVPPLRARASDILLIAHAFAERHAITPRASRQLERYSWPGNVAELRGVIQRALVLAGDAPIDLDHLPRYITDNVPAMTSPEIHLPTGGLNLEEVEEQLIRQALIQANGNKSKAAELLGLTRHTLLYRIEKYHIQMPERHL